MDKHIHMQNKSYKYIKHHTQLARAMTYSSSRARNIKLLSLDWRIGGKGQAVVSGFHPPLKSGRTWGCEKWQEITPSSFYGSTKKTQFPALRLPSFVFLSSNSPAAGPSFTCLAKMQICMKLSLNHRTAVTQLLRNKR